MSGNKISFGVTSKGNPMVIHKQYEFVKHRNGAPGNTQWRCKLHHSNKCQTRLTTKNNEIVRLTTKNDDFFIETLESVLKDKLAPSEAIYEKLS